MVTRMSWFLGITVYLIFANIFTFLIFTTLAQNGNDANPNLNSPDYDVDSTSGVKSNAQTLWNSITITYNTIGLQSALLYFIFIIIPSIFWWLLLASFILPTTNAGG